MQLLKDDPHSAPLASEFRGRDVEPVSSFNQNGTLVWFLQRGNAAQQCGFAGAACSHDTMDGSAHHIKIDTIKYRDVFCSPCPPLGKLAYLDDEVVSRCK